MDLNLIEGFLFDCENKEVCGQVRNLLDKYHLLESEHKRLLAKYEAAKRSVLGGDPVAYWLKAPKKETCEPV